MSYAGPPPIPPSGSGDDPNAPYGPGPSYGAPQEPSGPSPYEQPSGPYTPDPYGTPTPPSAPAAPTYGSPQYGSTDAPGAAPYGSPTGAPGASPYGTPSPMYGPVSPYATTGSTGSNGLAVGGLTLGIIGLLCGGIFAIIGLILSIQAHKASSSFGTSPAQAACRSCTARADGLSFSVSSCAG
ncbi:MAG: hypothetical protein J0H73_07155, partial [Salana multivorans]|nr:hypothetical protein [Salana multivorans]